jgi:hypothetical protein
VAPLVAFPVQTHMRRTIQWTSPVSVDSF